MVDHRLGFGLFFLAGGVLGVLGGAGRRRQKQALIRRAVRVNARVVSVKTESTNDDGGGVDVHYPTLEFVAAGKTICARLWSAASAARTSRRGKRSRRNHDPSFAHARCPCPAGLARRGLRSVLGLVFALIGAGLLWNWSTVTVT